jgi:hypothetical protein
MLARHAARLGLVLAFAGCGGVAARGADARPAPVPAGGAMRESGLHAPDDPTVRGARLLPASLQEAHVWGSEPGGAQRAVVAGLRIAASPAGDVRAAPDRLPASPSIVVEIPERLGSGFLLAVGPHLWRCASWLEPAAPVFTMPTAITDVLVGLDRVYLRSAQGPLVAIDPRTGGVLDLGPLPSSPRVASIAALDAWRAVAVADLRGTLITLDAGSSWRPVSLPIEPVRVVARDGGFAVAGLDRGRAVQWWEVLADGETDRVAPSSPPPAGGSRAGPAAAEAGTTPLGRRALLAAVEDGWPLTDGTALVARDGSLMRVRLADGSVVEAVPDAFPLRNARCHPLSLAREGERGAFGFACGEPRGSTVIFRWDGQGSRLVELRRFATPREVLASGNGALAVRGGCAGDGATGGPDGEPGEGAGSAGEGDAVQPGERVQQDWCLMTSGGLWSEMHFSGPGVDRARLAVLSNGHVALVRPPEEGDLSTARLTITDGVTDGARATHRPLRIEAVAPDVAQALRTGIWMDGFEERRPGVLGGWIDAAGSVLGIEITLDGEVHVGEYIRNAGLPVAAGRWAFGWTAAGGGFETTDGGMTWTKEIALPEPIAEPRADRDRACGPIGCVTAGWLRVGWGPGATAPSIAPPPVRPRISRRAPSLNLDCDAVDAKPPADATPAVPALTSGPARRPFLPMRSGYGPAVSEFRSFAGRAGPIIPGGDLGLSIDASHPFERGLRPRPLARAYLWGAAAGDWDPSGRWQVRWVSPWSGGATPDVRSTAVSPAPWPSLEGAARALGGSTGGIPEWTLVPGDDADHALLIERRAGLLTSLAGGAGNQSPSLEILETDRAPIEARRAGGEPLPDLQGAVRTGGRWYVATSQIAGEPSATVVWLLDGGVARELGRLPRVAPDLGGPARLARRVEGPVGGDSTSPIALLVTGADWDRGALAWVASFDPEAHAFGDPEPLAPLDLSDRAIAACTGDDAGWELETALPGTVDVRSGAGPSTRLQGVLARLRVSRAAACVSGIFGSADSLLAYDVGAAHGGAAIPGTAHTLDATVIGEHVRARLRCRVLAR